MSDRVTGAIAELYDADPGEFTARRKALADAARAAGERDAARQITALRKPTRAAWAMNRLARADPGAPQRLADLASGLRGAAEARDGRALRELSARRGELVDGLTALALEAAGIEDPTAGLREDVAATLTAALADPQTAAGFASGTLTRAAEWAGFGAFQPPDEDAAADAVTEHAAGTLAPAGADDAAAEAAAAEGSPAETEPAEDAPSDAAAPSPGARLKPAAGTLSPRTPVRPAPERPERTAKPKAPSSSPQAQTPRSRLPRPVPSRARPTAVRRATTAPSRAEAGDEAAARRRQAIEDAERTMATAAEAATAAVTEEERLEDLVRDLEERLTRARADLSAARLRARRAEAAEHRARQALDRLPRP